MLGAVAEFERSVVPRFMVPQPNAGVNATYRLDRFYAVAGILVSGVNGVWFQVGCLRQISRHIEH